MQCEGLKYIKELSVNLWMRELLLHCPIHNREIMTGMFTTSFTIMYCLKLTKKKWNNKGTI